MSKRSGSMTLTMLAGTSALVLAAGAHAQDAKLVQGNDAYYLVGEATLQKNLMLQKNTSRAKNVILMIADGMGLATVTATRILEGQLRGVDGESNVLSFEAFPYLAVAKTYSHDGQVSDSAPTATAMTTGVKTRNDVIGLNASVAVGDCKAAQTNTVTTIFEMAETAGKSTGAVSTARITHATPAAAYAHTPVRDWESDADMPEEAIAEGCIDIARQLVEWPYGDGMEVALGGGRERFLPADMADPEDPESKKNKRKDGKDLTKAWLERYGNGGAYVFDQAGFDAIDPANVTHLLGLFENGHMEFEADRAKDTKGEPSLSEMTAKAIDILAKDPEGYVLMIEGGRIDHAHHNGNAYRALTDAIEFDKAVKTVLAKVDLNETLIVVTGDHSHSFTISGYPERGNPILGLAKFGGELLLGKDEKPYTTLGYMNGPGAVTGERPDLREVDTTDPDYLQQALVPMSSETHAGEDNAIYAIGPWAHLFQGTVEQNYIFHVMNYASNITGQLAQN